MPYPIEDKFVIAVSASALFDTSEDEKIFAEQGLESYKTYQKENEDNVYNKGLAFDFIARFLKINDYLPSNPVEVVLFTRNSPDLGGRLMNTIKTYGLNICRTCFSSGDYSYKYLPSFNACLFLSCNEDHTRAAMKAGYAAGTVLKKEQTDTIQVGTNDEVEFAFDFDGVLANDAAERRLKENNGKLDTYFQNESKDAYVPLGEGPLKPLLVQIARLQSLEKIKQQQDPTYKKKIKTALITARNAPADRRVITTLDEFGVQMDKAFFMGGIDKSRVINIMRPQIYFDDDIKNLENLQNVVAIHVPYGVNNEGEGPSIKEDGMSLPKTPLKERRNRRKPNVKTAPSVTPAKPINIE